MSADIQSLRLAGAAIGRITQEGLLVIDPEDPATIERLARHLAPYSPTGDSWREWIHEARGVLKALAQS